MSKYYESELPKEIPELLPLVEYYCEKRLSPTIFTGMDVLFIQHHLGPFIPRIRSMLKYGLELSRCWFVDVPYSTCSLVRDQLLEIGCSKDQMVRTFNDPIAPYSRRQLERAECLIKRLATKDDSSILVIDDGAYFTRVLNHLRMREKELLLRFKERGTYIVEQTTRGHRYHETSGAKETLNNLEIPVVSIARARTKYELESPFIGASVAKCTMNALHVNRRLERGIGNVLVIGFGAVGHAVTKELVKLEQDKPIQVYDIRWEELSDQIKKIGAQPLKALPERGQYDTVFGCTGYASFPIDRLDILSDEAMLISGSSAAIEFNREKFIDLAYRRDADDFFIVEPEETRYKGIHAAIRMQRERNKFSFLNAGFPINFDGNLECLPYEIIQITHGLLIAAANQVLHKSTLGFCNLNYIDDEWFMNEGLKTIEKYATDE